MKQILLPAMAVALLLVSCTQPAEKQAVFTAPTIVNDTSTVTLVRNLEMEVRSVNGQTVIDVEKDGVKETITMADWEANKKMYEEKYGVLPPPPVPQSTVLIEDVGFTPPNIVKDENIKMNVRYKNGQTTIELEKNGVKESVKMADWEANKGMYEKKYGKLPPPPPPPPPAAPKPPPPPPPPVKS